MDNSIGTIIFKVAGIAAMAVIITTSALPLCAQTTSLINAPVTWKHKTLYALEGAACAASIADGLTTYNVVALGGRESNPLLVQAGTNGKVSWPKLILFKSILCGTPIVISYVAHRYTADKNSDYISLMMAGGSAGLFGWAAYHNVGVIAAQRKIDAMLAAQK